MRDHRKLKAFELADNMAVEIYRGTARFPKNEQFGLTSQMRRAAVSVASNIVEGCARHTQSDFLHFLDMAYGSACEVQYQVSLSFRLGFLREEEHEILEAICIETTKVINGLIRSIRQA